MARARKQAGGRGAAAGAMLGPNSYGKSLVRMMKVSRRGAVHTVREICVDIALEGDFEAVHTHGDNRKCLPTDTMKNTVYALGKDHPLETIESFALHLARHFVNRHDQVKAARVRITQTPWDRLVVEGKRGGRPTPHPHCFSRGTQERQTCEVTVRRGRVSDDSHVHSGLERLVILKSANSAFSGFPKDEFTTLPETRDRIFCTSVSARWSCVPSGRGPLRGTGKGGLDFAGNRTAIRRALVEAFAAHKSESVQQTLYAMGAAALRACRDVDRIQLSLPNRHCLLVNLAPFGMTNDNEIFVPTDEPHGLIEAMVERRGA